MVNFKLKSKTPSYRSQKTDLIAERKAPDKLRIKGAVSQRGKEPDHALRPGRARGANQRF
jgi:hypothetical protein